MKAFLTTLLCISLLANALLFYLRTQRPSTVAPPQEEKIKAVRKMSWAAQLSADWEKRLKAGDPEVALQLQEAGFPPEVVRELLEAQLRALTRAKAKELLRGVDPPPFWRQNFLAGASLSASERLDLQREEEALLKKLLGEDYSLTDVSKSSLYFLPPQIVERAEQIEEDYEALARTVHPEFSRVTLPAEREKFAFLEKEKRDELAQLLTPEQLFEYDLRKSDTADSLRNDLEAFQPTEAEFRDLFRIQRDADLKAGANSFSWLDPVVEDAKEKLQNEVDSKIEQRLGKERYAEYLRAQDSDFKELHTLAGRLKLPREKVAEAYAATLSFKERLDNLEGGPATMSLAASRAAAATIAAEAETRFRDLLGPEGFQAYRQEGYLFRNLSSYQEDTRRIQRRATVAAPPKS